MVMGCTDHWRRDWVVICGTDGLSGLSNDTRPALKANEASGFF